MKINLEHVTKEEIYRMLVSANRKRKKQAKATEYYRNLFRNRTDEVYMLMRRNIELRDQLRELGMKI